MSDETNAAVEAAQESITAAETAPETTEESITADESAPVADETAPDAVAEVAEVVPVVVAEPEDISYHAVEKEGSVTALWEMQGRRHLRTIDPRSSEGKQILALFESAA